VGGALTRPPFQETVNKAPRGAHDMNDKKIQKNNYLIYRYYRFII